MNVLVTGGAGLIGMACRERLARGGHRAIAIDITAFGRDDVALRMIRLDDRVSLETLIEREEIDAIVHCGAISGPMMARGKPLEIVAANIDATALLLDLARSHGLGRFVFCSSISVYGDVGDSAVTETTPCRPGSVYGASKSACEQLIDGFAAEYGLDGVSLRIARVYGPYRRANCHLRTMILDEAEGRPTEVACAEDFPYHYVYVDDVADAIVTVLEARTVSWRVYNVGSGETWTMPRIVDAARQVLAGLQATLVPGADEVPDRIGRFEIARMQEDLGWAPAFPLRRGIGAYREAFKAGRVA